MPGTAPIIETVYIPDIFVSGLAGVVELDGLKRWSFYVERPPVASQPGERPIVCHLLLLPCRERLILRELSVRSGMLS